MINETIKVPPTRNINQLWSGKIRSKNKSTKLLIQPTGIHYSDSEITEAIIGAPRNYSPKRMNVRPDFSQPTRGFPLSLQSTSQIQFDEEWSQEKDDLRCQLIDKFIQGDISRSEQSELDKLQQQAEDHFDEIAPPPMDGARLLHKKLLNKQQLDKSE